MTVPAAPAGRWRTRLTLRSKLLLVFGSAVVATALAEGVLHLHPLFRPTPITYVGEFENLPSRSAVVDPVIGWRMRPSFQSGIYQSNAQGFRAPADFDPAEKRRKILLAGDSFAFGTGIAYQDTFGAVIESSLPGSVVYDLGMPGFGLDQIWLSVRHHGLTLRPDLVIVAFISPDFTRSQYAYRARPEGRNKPTFHLVDGKLVPKTARDRPNALFRFLDRRSRLWKVGRLAAGHAGDTRLAGHGVP